MKCAVFSVVYPAVERYISEFLQSLAKQTDKDFTLFLINDGVIGMERYLEGLNLNTREIKENGFPAKLRKKGIKWITSEGFETIIFSDSDDYFDSNRIEISKNVLKEYDIVFNELCLVGENIPQPFCILERDFNNKGGIAKEYIIKGNCMGMSNTALRVKAIPSCDAISDNAIAFDWDLFSMCIHNGARAVFTNETKTYYRQHGGNIASPLDFSDEQIVCGVRVKKDHYHVLSGYYEEYSQLAEMFDDLFIQLKDDEKLKEKYCQAVRHQRLDNFMWWWPIKTLEELGL